MGMQAAGAYLGVRALSWRKRASSLWGGGKVKMRALGGDREGT